MSAGLFDKSLVPQGWFSENQQIAGWFDSSLLANAAGGSTATVTPATAALTIAGQIPAKAADRTVTPLLGAASMLGQAVTLSTQTTAEATITPVLGLVTVNGQAVSLQSLTTVAPGVGAVSFAGYSPSALRESGIGATTGLVSLVGYVPSLATEALVSPSVGAVAFLGAVPAVVTSEVAEATVTPDTAILGASGSIPWIELEAAGKSAKYRNRRTKYWWDEPSKAQVDPDVTPELPPNPPPLNVVAIPDSGMGAELNRINREIADTSAKLEAYRRKRARRREEEAIIALLAA